MARGLHISLPWPRVMSCGSTLPPPLGSEQVPAGKPSIKERVSNLRTWGSGKVPSRKAMGWDMAVAPLESVSMEWNLCSLCVHAESPDAGCCSCHSVVKRPQFTGLCSVFWFLLYLELPAYGLGPVTYLSQPLGPSCPGTALKRKRDLPLPLPRAVGKVTEGPMRALTVSGPWAGAPEGHRTCGCPGGGASAGHLQLRLSPTLTGGG